jgi:hypothetical protein
MDNMQILKVAEMDRYLDFWNLMVSFNSHAAAGMQLMM